LKEKQSVMDAFEIIMGGFKKTSMEGKELDEGSRRSISGLMQ
jgi:hypothetical protein